MKTVLFHFEYKHFNHRAMIWQQTLAAAKVTDRNKLTKNTQV